MCTIALKWKASREKNVKRYFISVVSVTLRDIDIPNGLHAIDAKETWTKKSTRTDTQTDRTHVDRRPVHVQDAGRETLATNR